MVRNEDDDDDDHDDDDDDDDDDDGEEARSKAMHENAFRSDAWRRVPKRGPYQPQLYRIPFWYLQSMPRKITWENHGRIWCLPFRQLLLFCKCGIWMHKGN